MSDIAIIQKATLYEMADAIIDTTERTESFKVSDMPTLIREEVYQKGYDNGFADGEASGGGGGGAEFDYIAYWDEMLGDFDTEVTGGYKYDEETGIDYYHAVAGALVREGYSHKMWHIPSGAIVDDPTCDQADLIVVPRGVTTIGETTIDVVYDSAGPVICLPTTPPTLGWQGAWSGAGGNMPPIAIYVPDDSVNAYKADTAWAEYADLIMPISEFEYFVTE